ncbi:oxidoreductase [Candidatus Daviesbacteria bacterium]|nr:oxidoreductase [Candidatus Daviesbacteria bacterium]
MIRLVDDFLNGITMYRLMLYVLLFLFLVTIILSLLKILPFNPINLVLSAAILNVVCWMTNSILSKIFKVPTNFESVFITAFILTLILTPIRTFQDLFLLSAVAVISQFSKYILAIRRKHLFNPAAFAVALSAIIFQFSASWWVGTAWMMPFILAAGILVVRKVQRFTLALSYLFIVLILVLGMSVLKGDDAISVVQNIFLETPTLFFVFVMLTEPQTTPPTKILQVVYGGLVGVGFPFVTPEIALLVGNIFSYIVSPKEKLLLKLKEKKQPAPDIYDFIFSLDKKFQFQPGQYLEWTLGYQNPDSRGNRRYFTIASSPTEDNLHIGVKFYPNSSTFKKKLISMVSKDEIVAGQLAGEFTLPKDSNQKLVFIAGGIGITPFRSMIKHLLDANQKRNIILLYSTKLEEEIVYKEIFDEAFKKLGIKTVYVVTETDGYIDAEKIKKEVPDFKDRIFYISGPHSMVDNFEETLKEIGISNNQIKIDFFPGYV